MVHIKLHQKKSHSFQLFFSLTPSLSSECCFPFLTAVQAWAGDCRAVTRMGQFVSNLTPTYWLPHTLRLETTHGVTSPSECHVSTVVHLLPRQAISNTMYSLFWVHWQDRISALSTQTWWKLRERGNSRIWYSCFASAQMTERGINVEGRWVLTHWEAETFLTCLVSLHRRLISLALPCKYTRVLVIKRAWWQTSSRFESSASSACL